MRKTYAKRVVCILMAFILSFSFSLVAQAVGIIGDLDANDEATLISPTLQISSTPQNAVAIARNLVSNTTHYYNISADITALNPYALRFQQSGFVPEFVQNSGGVVSPNAVIGTDDREAVESTEQYPYRAIGVIVSEFWEEVNGRQVFIDRFIGTATMISPDVAVTAAHCLYDEVYGWPDIVTVYPGIYGTTLTPQLPYGINSMGEVIEMVISIPYYESSLNFQHDWGLVRLSEPIGNYSGYLGFEYVNSSLVSDNSGIWPVLAGYPKTLCDINNDGERDLYQQYFACDEIVADFYGYTTSANGASHQYREIRHHIDGTEGQSGSALLKVDLFSNTPFTIVGIYQGCRENEFSEIPYNDCVGIGSHLYSFMLAYKNG